MRTIKRALGPESESPPPHPQNSYYAALGLFLLSLPGLYSLVARSAKSKVERKTFIVPGPANPQSEPLDQLARRISSYFRTNNYRVKEAGETITCALPLPNPCPLHLPARVS